MAIVAPFLSPLWIPLPGSVVGFVSLNGIVPSIAQQAATACICRNQVQNFVNFVLINVNVKNKELLYQFRARVCA